MPVIPALGRKSQGELSNILARDLAESVNSTLSERQRRCLTNCGELLRKSLSIDF